MEIYCSFYGLFAYWHFMVLLAEHFMVYEDNFTKWGVINRVWEKNTVTDFSAIVKFSSATLPETFPAPAQAGMNT